MTDPRLLNHILNVNRLNKNSKNHRLPPFAFFKEDTSTSALFEKSDLKDDSGY